MVPGGALERLLAVRLEPLRHEEYHAVYGEDVEAALRFFFNVIFTNNIKLFHFHGRPKMVYTDNGPVARSHVFQRVIIYLDIELKFHLPQGHDGRRVTARAKGKKEIHETLYHFHKPNNQKEANLWLMNYLLRYNEQRRLPEVTGLINQFRRLGSKPKLEIEEGNPCLSGLSLLFRQSGVRPVKMPQNRRSTLGIQNIRFPF